MPPNTNDPNELNAVDSLEHSLYDPKQKTKDVSRHFVVDAKEKEIPSSWTTDRIVSHTEGVKQGASFGTIVLIGSLIALILAIGFTAWRVLSSRNVVSSEKIVISVDTSPTVEGGESVPFVVSLENQNESSLEEVVLTLSYKQGIGSQDEEEKVSEKRILGVVNAKDYRREEFSIIVYGSEGESRDFSVNISYKVAGSNAVFSKTMTQGVVIKTPPLSVHVDGPKNVSIGEETSFTVSVKNTTSTSSRKSLLLVTLPTTFTITSSSPKKNDRANSWIVPELLPGDTYEVTLTGNISGTEGEVATIRSLIGSLGSSLSAIDVVYSSYIYDITLEQSPLLLSVALDTERAGGDSLLYGDRATLAISYSNKSGVPLRDVGILLSFSGEAVDTNRVSVENGYGYYDSTKKTVLWDKASLPELATISPGGGGVVRVTLPIVLKGTNSPALAIVVQGRASTQTTNDVVVNISKNWTVQGTASLKAETHYKTSSLPNTGPIPPKPNVDTTYTARLFVSAQNALSSAVISFTLPAYVTWKNATSDSAHIQYNPNTRTVVWALSNVEAGKTTVADIQLSVKPSQSQVNLSPQITSNIILDAQEEVSRSRIKMTLPALSTKISGEGYTNEAFVVTP